MKELLNHLPAMRGKKIGVLGDLIADEYVYGTVHRFSREAPVFIVDFEQSQVGPGGAANAINNIFELGGLPYPFGILGNDPPGRSLLSSISKKGISTDGILLVDHPTFVKQRVVAGSPHSVKQQILRIDRCIPITDSPVWHSDLCRRVEAVMDEMDAFIISDYGLGVAQAARLEAIVAELNRRSIACFIDSRHNLLSYRSFTAATPNEPEVEAILGREMETRPLLDLGKALLARLEAKALLITRGKNGMLLFTGDGDPVQIPIFGSSDIVDVTGAGDTVISAFALAHAAGASFYDAARLANCAAGLVVMKRGAATLSPEELVEAITTEAQRGRRT